jgi:HAD superfamily hydrolase (TIGR01450 family)
VTSLQQPAPRRPAASPLADAFDHFLLDLDGVIYLGGEPIAGSVETVLELRRRGRQVRFVTNDPTNTAEFYADRLARIGLPTPPAEIVPVARAMLEYLQAQDRLEELTVHVVGSPGMKEYFAAAGLRLVDGPAAESADVVAVGGWWDFDYHQLKTAGRAARQARHFLLSAWDAAFPMPDGAWPGAGSIAAGIAHMAGRQPVAVGKPERWLFRTAAETLPPGGRIAMVGDNLETDILGAQRAGYSALLVLTGHTRPEDLEQATTRPDYVLERLADVLEPG